MNRGRPGVSLGAMESTYGGRERRPLGADERRAYMANRRLRILLAVLGVLFAAHLVVNKPWRPRPAGHGGLVAGFAPRPPRASAGPSLGAWPAQDAFTLIPRSEEGLTLPILPSELVSWADWRSRHPDTLVLSRDTGHRRDYAGTAYADYFRTDRIMFDIPGYEGPTTRFKNKDLFVIAFTDDASRAYSVREVLEASQDMPHLDDQLGGRTIRLSPDREGNSIRVAAADGRAEPATFYLFYFELAVSHPDVEVFDPR